MRQDTRRASRGIASRLASAGRLVLKVVAFVVVVPALCLVVGAVPLYLLLPSDKPASPPSAPVTTATAVPAAPTPVLPKATEPMMEKTATADPEPVGSVSRPAEEPPAEEAASEDAAPMPEAVAVVPTPRPEPPALRPPEPSAKPADAPQTKVAALDPADSPNDRADPKTPSAAGRATVRRNVTLRTAPHGRELGTLREGTRVAVGRCDEWCEVEADGQHGWVHSSFLAGALPAHLDAGRAEPAQADRRETARREREAREARAWARAEERRRAYADAMDEPDPGWFIDDDRPAAIERRRPPPDRYYEPDGYEPY